MGVVHQILVFLIDLPFLPFIVLWHQFCFHKPVQFREQDIGKNRAEYIALRHARERFIPLPVFHISCIEELFDEIEEPSILDMRERVLR